MTTVEFFEALDETKVVERNIRRIVSMELDQVRRFQKIYKAVLNDLNRKIQQYRGSQTFTEAQASVLRVELEQLKKSLERASIPLMGDLLEDNTEQAATDTEKEINAFERKFLGIRQRLPFEAIRISMDRGTYLINNLAASLEKYNDGIRQEMERIISEGILGRKTYQGIRNEMGLALPQFEGWKLARIVRTESHSIYNASKMLALRETKEAYLPDLKKTRITPLDGRTGEDSLHEKNLNLVVEVDEPFVYNWKGERREFYTIDRPNDRGIVVPYREAWLGND